MLNGTGMLFTQGDSKGFADAIDFLVDNESIREKLGSSAKEFATKSYTWDSHTNQVIRVLETVLKNG